MSEGEPEIIGTRQVHSGWTTLSILTIRLGDGAIITREVEHHGSAAAVLPFDPERRVAMLVRLLRAPLLWKFGISTSLEVPAGLREDEEAVVAARREVFEEAGLRLQTLDHVGRVWSMPGLSTETLDLFLAAYSEGDRVGPGGGVASENEDIVAEEWPLARLGSMLDRGEIADHKTLTLLLALRLRQPGLFAP